MLKQVQHDKEKTKEEMLKTRLGLTAKEKIAA